MKALKTVFALSLVTFFLSSYIVPNKTAEPVPYITFENEAGEEITKALTATALVDWKDKVKSAEFRVGEEVVEVTGLFIHAPKAGDAFMVDFKENSSFTIAMQKIGTDVESAAGDRLILDRLMIEGQEKFYTPIVHLLK